ncbi:hypothetical protein D9619_012206 [Psilocybe cf. subviscida]|uniref:Uncharacterized protein n=1 Tax=Psilocybe cf. subviscida TaxID=2480587 RepID=A0A8H5B736_9AGAR|nr:hypothetical protein D9619_012206 [Psilocybe cf. subviscida]
MSLSPVTVIHIHIDNIAIQANILRNGGGRVTQENTLTAYGRIPEAGRHSNAPNFTTVLSRVTERRVEAQQRIRRKLEEVSAHSEGTLSRLRPVSSLATAILSVVEQKYVSCNMQLVDLAMDAHAVAYIAVISFLYRRQRMSKKRTKKLIELLGIIHTFLMDDLADGNIIVRLKRVVSRSRRKLKVMHMREELLSLLRRIERDDNADVLSSLNAALNHPSQ